MRVPALLLTLLLAALFMSACGGPDDSEKRQTAACERQIKEIAEIQAEQSSTPVAPSTTKRLDREQLVECAGQPANTSAAQADAGASENPVTEKADDTPAPGTDETKVEPDTEKVTLDPAARELFISSCGGCHTLSDAGTNGAVGPNLDETKMDAAAITTQIQNGKGAMPGGLLTGDDASAVGEYVAGAAAAAQAG